MTNQRAAQVRRAGTPGPEGSVGKLAYAEENQRVYELCMDLLGNEGMLYPAGYPMIRPKSLGMGTTDVHKSFLRVRANSIEGGTSEVMRNILGGARARVCPVMCATTRSFPGRTFPAADAGASDRGGESGHTSPRPERGPSVWRWQRTVVPLGVTKGSGSTDAQMSMAKGQRWRKRHPDSALCPMSTSPVRTMRGIGPFTMGVRHRDGREQCRRVGMGRAEIDLVGVALLDDLARGT